MFGFRLCLCFISLSLSLSLEALFLLLNNTLCDFLSSVGSPFVSLVCVCVFGGFIFFRHTNYA